MATCSDHPRRSEIIRLAAQRAGRSLSDAIYIGDGVWDLRACRELGVRFIGTGSRLHLLKKAGAEHTAEVLDEALLWNLVASAAVQRRAGFDPGLVVEV